MNDEIKEIIDKLEKLDDLTTFDYVTLYTYITNLQQENEKLKEKIKYASDKLVGYINAPYVITNEYFEDIIRTIEENTDIQIGTNCMDFMEELEDYKSRIEKADWWLKEMLKQAKSDETKAIINGTLDLLLNGKE